MLADTLSDQRQKVGVQLAYAEKPIIRIGVVWVGENAVPFTSNSGDPKG